MLLSSDAQVASRVYLTLKRLTIMLIENYQEVMVFLPVLEAKFPGVTFLSGQPAATDPLGKPYVTLSLGGIKEEGAPAPTVINVSSETLFEYFYVELGKYLTDVKTCYVRALPTIREETVYVLDPFDPEVPQLIPLVRKKITGRFSFHP